jgi:hypothetical protein
MKAFIKAGMSLASDGGPPRTSWPNGSAAMGFEAAAYNVGGGQWHDDLRCPGSFRKVASRGVSTCINGISTVYYINVTHDFSCFFGSWGCNMI